MNILTTHHELSTHVSDVETTAKAAIAKLLEAQKLNEAMQKKHAPGSPDWHMHESIDDRIHDVLSLLGD